MKYLVDFLEAKDITKTEIFSHLKCSTEEAIILRHITKHYVLGLDSSSVNDLLIELFGDKKYEHLNHLDSIKNLLDLGWINENSFLQKSFTDISKLEMLSLSFSPSVALMRLLEGGNVEITLPDIVPYIDHLEYLKDQFFKIELYQKLSNAKQGLTQDSPSIHRLKSRIELIDARIEERLKVTKDEFYVETLFKSHELNQKEKIIFLALLKEEYSGDYDSLRDLNTLMDLVSFDNYEKIQNRALLEDGSKLLESGLIDYDEMITAFGGIGRSFYIVEEELHKIIHPNKTKKRKIIKLNSIIEEQDIFELLTPHTTLEDVVLDSKTEELMRVLLQRMDKNVSNLLKQWGLVDKKRGLEARILFHGHPGTGKTMTALSLAKSLKKEVLSFDCSKILSMYVGESEKNVRKIFDTYKDLAHKTKSEPILLLDEADQFLGSRSSSVNGSADRSHNQMQNIFLEQIEKFDGILIATTNLLDSLDKAFSRRFDYKIEFKKPNFDQRVLLWERYLPKNADFEKSFDIKELANLPITGGQIKLIIKNTALKVATKSKPIFCMSDFKESANREISSTFGESGSLGFV